MTNVLIIVFAWFYYPPPVEDLKTKKVPVCFVLFEYLWARSKTKTNNIFVKVPR